MVGPRKQPPDHWAILLVIAALPLRTLLALTTDLSPDEAYYLSVARHELPFRDHPPLVTWLADLVDVSFIPMELGARLPTLLLGTAVGGLLIAWVWLRGGDEHAQRWIALLGSWMALPMAGGFLATPDMPMLSAMIALVILLEWQPSESTGRAHQALRLVGITAVCAMGMSAKVSMLVPALAGMVAARRVPDRIAVILGVGLALPWTWPSLAFQLEHAFAGDGGPHQVVGPLAAVAAAVGAQLALWGPALVVGGKQAARRSLDRSLVISLTVLILISAAVRGVAPEPNWFAPAAIALVVGASHVMHRAARWLRVVTIMVGPLLALVFAVHVVKPWLPLPTTADPSARLHGWRTGNGPKSAPGVGSYGVAAEACVYQDECNKIIEIQMDINKVSSDDEKTIEGGSKKEID